MKAHALAKRLLEMPNIEVGYAHGDNSAHEVAGECCSVNLLVKADIDTDGFSGDDLSMYESLPKRLVVIRG